MTRRKYLYASRQEAENAYCKANQQGHNQLRLARALYQGTVTWGKTRGDYRMGVFDLNGHGEPKMVKVFAPPTGQEPDLEVFGAFSHLLDRLEIAAARWGGKHGADLMACIREAREIVRRLTQ